LLHIQKYCPNTNEVFLSILVYFDRMSKLAAATDRKFVIDSYNVHRLVIAGVTTASKFLSDICYPNSRWAKVGGLSQAELNELELQFVLLNDFRLVIHQEKPPFPNLGEIWFLPSNWGNLGKVLDCRDYLVAKE
ncbi:cyclin-domain-containing protein, partial [Mycena olivaceomarginata]